MVVYFSPHRFVLVAPAVLKAGSEENILLEAFGLSQSIDIDLSVHTYPGSSQLLLNSTVTLNADNHYSALATITVILLSFILLLGNVSRWRMVYIYI